jgi:flagellar FliL protein
MATDASAQPTDAAAAASGGVKKHLPFVLALVGGLALGGAGGAFFVGPAMAGGIAPAAAAAGAEGDAAEADGEERDGKDAATERKDGEGPAKNVHTLDNLVLNPAGSNGTRFLLLTIALEVKNEPVLEEMKARDAELRDAVLATLGGKSVEQLAEMAKRDALKDELRDVAAKLFRPGAVKRVYFPQFVIQ